MMNQKELLTEEQIDRYSRQIVLAEVGGIGMKKLLKARVGIVGAGGLGCPAAQVLAAAGVGTLRIIDGDRVELSNLARQLLHYTTDIGKFKVDTIKMKIEAMNPDVLVETFQTFADRSNIKELLQSCDYIIEASDHLATKFLVNDACIHLNIPFTISGVLQFYGQIISVIPGETRCYRCLFQKPRPEDPLNTCSGAGVMGTVPDFAGILQANEAIKSILGLNNRMTNRFLDFDLLENSFRFFNISDLPKCDVCSNPREPFYLTYDYGAPGYECHIQKNES